MKRTAVIYLRQSLDRDGDGAAVDRQREDCLALARSRGWRVVGVHEDNDTSAAGKAKRPGFEAVLDAVASRRASVVVAWDLTRLTRNARDRLRLLEVGRTAEATIALARGSDFDLSTTAGRLTADILGAVAQGEIEQKGERQRRANEQRRARGDALWTRRPYGYDRDGAGAVLIVPHEAAVIRWAALRIRAGLSLGSTQRILNARGITTTTGGPWPLVTLRRMLINPRLSGGVTHDGRVVADGTWPRILEPETQEAVRSALADPRRKRMHDGGKNALRWLMSGSVRCGVCGARMFSQAQGPLERRVTAYTCRTSTRGTVDDPRPRHVTRLASDVDHLVSETVLARLSLPDASRMFLPHVDLDELRQRADSLRQRRDALAQLLADGVLSHVAVREQATRLTAELGEVESRLSAATGASPVAKVLGSADVRQAWNALTVRARREIVDALLVATILPSTSGPEFDPESVRIEWRTP